MIAIEEYETHSTRKANTQGKHRQQDLNLLLRGRRTPKVLDGLVMISVCDESMCALSRRCNSDSERARPDQNRLKDSNLHLSAELNAFALCEVGAHLPYWVIASHLQHEPCAIVHSRTGSKTPLHEEESKKVKTLINKTFSRTMGLCTRRAYIHPMSVELLMWHSFLIASILSVEAITQTRACSVVLRHAARFSIAQCDLGSWYCSPRARDAIEENILDERL